MPFSDLRSPQPPLPASGHPRIEEISQEFARLWWDEEAGTEEFAAFLDHINRPGHDVHDDLREIYLNALATLNLRFLCGVLEVIASDVR
jgi:hypothetical protein